MRVLSVASECAPLVKTGGLADVVGALPGAVAAEGVDMRVLLPGYPAVMAAVGDTTVAFSQSALFGGTGRVLSARAHGIDLLILEAAHLYDRPGNIYLGPDGKDWPDNPERFAALCQIAARIAQSGVDGWMPDVIHAHDWQAGLIPEYLDQPGRKRRVGTVLTVHNMAFHGLADPAKIDLLGLDPARMDRDGFEFWGHVSALKAGLIGADRLTTVSPSYARELMTEAFGMGLEGVMRMRRGDLSGILNGIDTEVWNPATDAAVTRFTTPKGKAQNKRALRKAFDLPKADGPLCVLVSRLTDQKGVDMLLEVLPRLLAEGGQLVVLGSGDPHYEDALRNAARDPNVGVHIGYDEGMSHRLIAGGDAILVPSRFEPCGLTQLYGLRYGTIPLVALTGGLADTVIDASPAARAVGAATGVQFHPVTAEAFGEAITRLCALFRLTDEWAGMQENAMSHPVGWDMSARAYAALYRDVTSPE